MPFCYICAQDFESGAQITRDHVPPSILFAKSDRNVPLVLPTHQVCNHSQSADDEVIDHLVRMLRGESVAQYARRPDLFGGTFPDGSTGVGSKGLDLKKIIWRWVRGFHAALYRSPVRRCGFRVFPPFPEGRVVGDRVEPVDVPEVIPHFVEEINRNRATGTVDSLICRRGQCRYECVWTQADSGHWFCVWALDIYGWSQLGDINHFQRRGCVGMYRLLDQPVPVGAEVATRLHFSSGTHGLDPFEAG